MRILFLTNIPSPYRVDFFNELGKKCDLTVLYERESARNRDKKWFKNKAISFNEVYLNGLDVGNDSALCFNVFKWLRDRNFDLIIVGGYSTPTGMLAIEYLSLKKIPFVLNSDGGFIKNDNQIRYFVKKHFISKAIAWLSPSKNTDNYLIHYGAKKENIYRYPFTSLKNADILKEVMSDAQKSVIKRKLKIKENKMILSVGQFINRKGFDVLLNACKTLEKDTAVYIVGGEPTEEYLELKKKFNLSNVYFKGFKTKEELTDYYKAADLFVLPTREDVWGLVINEAMAYGLPVITTDKCGAGLELVKDNENGFIVPVDDYNMLANKINVLLSDEKKRKNMAKVSLTIIKEYSIENMAAAHIKIFETICKKLGKL